MTENTMSHTYQDAAANFNCYEGDRLRSFYSPIRSAVLGVIDGITTCQIETVVKHPLNKAIYVADAIDELLEKLREEKVTLVYPEDYKTMTGDLQKGFLYILAENKIDLANALEKIPSLPTNRIRADLISEMKVN